jgi:hypothetical protein
MLLESHRVENTVVSPCRNQVENKVYYRQDILGSLSAPGNAVDVPKKNLPKLPSTASLWCAPASPWWCVLLHLCFVLHVSLTLMRYGFVEREAKRLCCSTGEVVRRLVEAAMREREERRGRKGIRNENCYCGVLCILGDNSPDCNHLCRKIIWTIKSISRDSI